MNSQTQFHPPAPAKSLQDSSLNSSINLQQQLCFASIDNTPGALNDDSLVRGIITSSIKQSGKSREQIAEEMSESLAVQVTARMITSFTAESKELHRWPGAWDRAFCQATGDHRLLIFRVERSGLHVINDDEHDLLELGRQYLLRNQADDQIVRLQRRLRGVAL